MLLVAVTVTLSAAVGVLCEHRAAWAATAARGCLSLMLYALVPFVSYVSFAHLQLSLGAGVGLGIAYLGLALAGTLAWRLGRRVAMPRPALGGVILCAVIANTGYLGYPMAVALLGSHALSHAVAYDQVVSSPMVFTVGFGLGAVFGAGGRARAGAPTAALRRARSFITRNPPLLAAVAGLLVPAWLAPKPLVAASHAVVDSLLVLGFFAVGVFLSSERREDGARLLELPSRAVLVALLARLCVNPALLGVASLAGVGIPSAYLLQAVMPSGINCLLIGHAYGLDQRLIATVIVWGTILVLAVGMVAYLA